MFLPSFSIKAPNTRPNQLGVIFSQGTPAMQFSVFNGWLVATADLAKFSYNHQVAPVEVVRDDFSLSVFSESGFDINARPLSSIR